MTFRHKPEEGLRELKAFIESVKLDASALSAPNAETKGVYRKFYALLVYDYILQDRLHNADQRTYAKETISDISHGLFLTCIGLYKPARTSARSAIENIVRFLLLYKGVDAQSINSVFELFEKSNDVFSNDEKQKERIGKLRQVYRELCRSVHSSSADYMNLEVPFSTMLIFDQSKFQGNIDIVQDCCRIFGELFFVELNEFVRTCHHTHRDLLSDSVARNVRKEISERARSE